MTLTTYPATTDSSDLPALNLTRLLSRLEHNLLSPNADLTSLQRSEYQRMRVSSNIDYARTTLQSLERNLPQIKPVDRRHELQTTLSRSRQTLKRLQSVLDEIQSEVELRSSSHGSEWDGDSGDEAGADEEDLLGTPEGGSTADEAAPEDDISIRKPDAPSTTTTQAPTSTVTPSSSSDPNTNPTPTPSASASASTVLRNRHHNVPPASSTPSTSTRASATGTSHHTAKNPPQSTESPDDFTTDNIEQETLTDSLLTLATQLKNSSQAFQSSLEAEKSVLSRATEGLDRTTGSLAAAEKRMGMLRRMTEGTGWWGRMMLYAWIFALWIVAFLIVFVGPKLRF
ncbi:hypothetical protein BJX99DRAFT_221689 [Aspergillus californicus]